jgi:hypothetical protein
MRQKPPPPRRRVASLVKAKLLPIIGLGAIILTFSDASGAKTFGLNTENMQPSQLLAYGQCLNDFFGFSPVYNNGKPATSDPAWFASNADGLLREAFEECRDKEDTVVFMMHGEEATRTALRFFFINKIFGRALW